MSNAITMGIFWHLIGAASAACFYAPFKKVKKWSWETMWSVGGIVSWIILPWAISALLLPNFWAYYSSFSLSTLLPVFLFGAMWGIGNINYGLTMRYLGMSMGIGIAIGITLIVGTLMTPIINGNFDVLISTEGGRMTLLGVLVALIGVGIVTRAGQLKERKMGIKAEEFNLKKGLVLAVMCGIFSAGMSFAMNAAKPMHEAAAALGVDPLYVALPSYVVIMGGGAMLGAIFMATDYVTSPVTKKGQLIFGIGCGLITVFIRYFGSYPEGVCYSILVMNCCTWIIDKYTKPTRFGVDKKAAKEAAKK